MEEVVVKKVDSQGRVSIPVEWRKKWRSNKVVLKLTDKNIELTPIDPISPSTLFDSIEVSDDVDFTDPHSLKKALLEKER
jgi:bifunctional DNA-binding transcriptional regulator/antitoxin component of YhaV-PrlF toxin-antitoxin module